MKRIPFDPAVNDSPSARYSRNTHYYPATDNEELPRAPGILAWLLICALAVVLALLTGCTQADAQEQPSAAQLEARQEMRRAAGAIKACGPGETPVWQDDQTITCHYMATTGVRN